MNILEEKEFLIGDVLRRMAGTLKRDQAEELKDTLNICLSLYTLERKKEEVLEVSDEWKNELRMFLTTKALEGKSKETLHQYSYELYRLLSYINLPAAQITSSDIFDYLQVYKRVRGVSNQTLENKRLVYSSFFSFLHSRNLIPGNPMSGIGKIKTEKRIKKPYSDEELELILKSCRNIRDRAMLEFLYSTGIRVSELSRLNIQDVEFSTKELTVYGKGDKERRVYMNARSALYLRNYLQSREDRNPALFVSLRKPYSRLTKSGIENIVRETGIRANVGRAYPHRFRRTTATNLLSRGMPVQEVSTILGHASLKTTMLYCDIDQESVKQNHRKYLV